MSDTDETRDDAPETPASDQADGQSQDAPATDAPADEDAKAE